MPQDHTSDATRASAVANHVLVVEDDAEEAARIAEFLRSRGHRVSIAKDGGQAHSTFTMRTPDFVILDLILSGESGFEVCERLKQIDERIPILVATAITLDDSRRLAERVGADAYMTKPFSLKNLADEIESVAQTVWERFHLDGANGGDDQHVRFHCSCGKKMKASAAHRGRTLTCSDCGGTVVVPRHS